MSKQWGAAPVCPACKKSVYPLEEVFAADRKRFHRECLQCKAKGCRHQTGGGDGRGHCRLIFSAITWQRRTSTSTRTATTSAVSATTRSTDPGWALTSSLDFSDSRSSLFRNFCQRARRPRQRRGRGWPGRPRRGTGGGRRGRTRGSGWRWRRKKNSTSPSWRSLKS